MKLKNLLTTHEAAKLLRASHRTLEGWRFRNVGPPYIQLGERGIRYSRDDLEAWLEGQMQRPRTAAVGQA